MLKHNAQNPLPEGGSSGTIFTSDKVKLRFARWPAKPDWIGEGAAPRAPRGTVAILQGRTEFIEKYYEVIEELRGRGFHVATFDWRGQGGSERLLKDAWKGHVPNFKHFERDLEAFIRNVMLPDCPPPYFALAHSMGGMVTFASSASGSAVRFERAIYSAPMLHLKEETLKVSQRTTRRVMTTLSRLGLGRIALSKEPARFSEAFEGNPLTSDKVRFARFNQLLDEFPELGIGPPTIGWLAAACKAMQRGLSARHIRNVKIPSLIVAAGKDPIIDTSKLETVARKMRVARHVVISGAKHEILFERDELRDQFWAAFDAFIPGTGPLLQARSTAIAVNENADSGIQQL